MLSSAINSVNHLRPAQPHTPANRKSLISSVAPGNKQRTETLGTKAEESGAGLFFIFTSLFLQNVLL